MRVNSPILNGWKEISKYLGISTRYAMKLRKEYNLPVCDVGRIFAHTDKLDEWVKDNPSKT